MDASKIEFGRSPEKRAIGQMDDKGPRNKARTERPDRKDWPFRYENRVDETRQKALSSSPL